MNIPKFQLKFNDKQIEDFVSSCRHILRADRPISNGDFVREFEHRFAKWIGAKHAVAVGCGTDALEVTLRVLDVQDKYVIIPTNTMIGTALAVERAGGEVVLTDIEDSTFAMSPDYLADELDFYKEVGAVILVHIGGTISRFIEDIIGLCEEYSVPLIEDAAQAHGARRGIYRAGSIGDMGAFSFSATKVMTTGEGGMVTTDSNEYAEKARQIRDEWLGGNFKMTEFQALLGLTELNRVDKRITKRRTLSQIYCDSLNRSLYQPIPMGDASYYKQIVYLCWGNKVGLYAHCLRNQVNMTGEVYSMPIHQCPSYRHRFQHIRFNVSDMHSTCHFCPPNYPELSEEEVKYVCEVLNEVK